MALFSHNIRIKLRRRRYRILLASTCIVGVLWLLYQPTVDPPSLDLYLHQLNRSRNVWDYIKDVINPLLEPAAPCTELHFPTVALVSSSPDHLESRAKIRETWGKEIQAYFFIGMGDGDEQLIENFIESKQHNDLIVYDLPDLHNETLKVVLMLQWGYLRCPAAEVIVKCADDVLVNPWRLAEMLNEREVENEVIGHVIRNSPVDRSPTSLRYLPTWLYTQNTIPVYLHGSAYVFKGKHLKKIYNAALQTPLLHIEDLFISYLVTKLKLKYILSNDYRIVPYKPYMPLACNYFQYAVICGVRTSEMANVWNKIYSLEKYRELGRNVCTIFDMYGVLSGW